MRIADNVEQSMERRRRTDRHMSGCVEVSPGVQRRQLEMAVSSPKTRRQLGRGEKQVNDPRIASYGKQKA